jgi:hypothetical protein
LLGCQLEMTELHVEGDAVGRFVVSGVCRATNTGAAKWLPSDTGIGGVNLGARLNDPSALTRDLDLFPLSGEGVPVGQHRDIPFGLEVHLDGAGGSYLEFDLVSNSVGWFSVYGSNPCIVPLQTAP